MKLRLNDHSVRLRVGKSEVKALAERGTVSTTLAFPGGTALTFRASAGAVERVCVSYQPALVEVLLPAAAAARWASSDEVGIYGQQDGIDILLEKDFRRTSLPSPDDEDRYPNPRSASRV